MIPQRVNPTRLAGELTGTCFEGWTDAIKADFTDNAHNDMVGSVLLENVGSQPLHFVTVEHKPSTW